MYYKILSKIPSAVLIDSKQIEDKIDPNYNNALYIEYLDNQYDVINYSVSKNGDIIEELTDYTANGSFAWLKDNVSYSDNTGIPFVKIKNITDNGFDFNDLVYVDIDTYTKLKKSQLNGGELLFSKTGSVGLTLVVPKDCDKMSLADNIFKVIYKSDIDVHYVDAFYKSKYGKMWVKRLLQGGVQPTIIKESFRQIKIPIPSKEIQKYIGDKVRKAEELREEAKRLKKEAEEILNNELNKNKADRFNIKNEYIFINDKPNILYVSEELIDNTRIEAVFYKKEDLEIDSKLVEYKHGYKLLKDICVKITDGTHKTPTYIENGVTFISSKNILEDEIDFENVKYISKEEHKEISKRCNVEHGDLLFTKIGRIGYAKVVPDKLDTFSIFVSVALLKLKKKVIDEYFLQVFLNSEYGKKQSKRLSKGSNQPDFHLEDIGQLKIPILPIEIQKEIGNKMRKVEELKYDVRVLIHEAKQDVEDLIEGNFDMSKIKKIN
ncbi:restriction endonuclease subunit S [Anaeromicropila herbilytica]|uniref:Type I restriction modification DNA specificity domain-containing protein n=1 Tax=Anaeromicropila herbilytica TaxID=2785025 RepID=A0A7R7EJ62_9FIRM|nr:restriction endonuclease subunit S [Anaeromicropila herbilytica]BCN30115.1 hypothetical protein bsdtb5_14100 [Anaeromicropila herbilytica]